MPTSPPRRCRYCGELVNGSCPDCDKGWSRKPASWSLLTSEESTAWRKFRVVWLAAHPWCMDCGQRATVVCHHPGTDYSRDRVNPLAIEGQRCKSCDASETTRQSNRSRRT